MTLNLEQVRQTRFHLARRNGYEPMEVDSFVDKVEATLSQLLEENETLKKQVETLGSSEPDGIYVGGEDTGRSGQDDRQVEVENLRGELDGSRGELETVRTQLNESHAEVERLRAELAGRDEELNQLRNQTQPQAVVDDGAPTGKVENIVVTASSDAAPAVTKLLQMATEQSERLVGDAQVEAKRTVEEAQAQANQVVEEANQKAHETLTDARTRAERIESEARVNADRLNAEAQSHSDAVKTDADARRVELFSDLETERDDLRGRVDHLRSFEGNFRQNLTAHLQSQIDSLKAGVFEPEDTPSILNEPAPESATPRLDALLGDQN